MRPLIVLLAVIACGSPQKAGMNRSGSAERDLFTATMRMMPVEDSVAVLVQGVSVYAFEYLDYDIGIETAAKALRRTFYNHFLPALQDYSKPTLTKFTDSLGIGSFSQKTLPLGKTDSLTIAVPEGQAAARNPDIKADFYLFVQNLAFDVREQLFYGRSRRVYLRVNFDYAIWDSKRSRLAKSGQVSLSERASFGVANGTFKPTFSQRTWSKTLAKAAELVLKNSALAK
ncbi:hypothetical protein MJD09_07890 [bacterium]|nr:hypothetical protein [bacterium]